MVAAVLRQVSRANAVEVIVVDDGSTDDTARRAEAAGARVLQARPAGEQGNPAAARNFGARESRGDPIIFLDADCIVAEGWIEYILAAHEQGATVVGGSLSLPPGTAGDGTMRLLLRVVPDSSVGTGRVGAASPAPEPQRAPCSI